MKNGDLVSAKPTDWSDAVNRIRECAIFIQEERPAQPNRVSAASRRPTRGNARTGRPRSRDDSPGTAAAGHPAVVARCGAAVPMAAPASSAGCTSLSCVSTPARKSGASGLEELVKEIEDRKLEEWEAGENDRAASGTTSKVRRSDDESRREELFSRLCRIDPIAALNVSH